MEPSGAPIPRLPFVDDRQVGRHWSNREYFTASPIVRLVGVLDPAGLRELLGFPIELSEPLLVTQFAISRDQPHDRIREVVSTVDPRWCLFVTRALPPDTSFFAGFGPGLFVFAQVDHPAFLVAAVKVKTRASGDHGRPIFFHPATGRMSPDPALLAVMALRDGRCDSVSESADLCAMLGESGGQMGAVHVPLDDDRG